MPMKYLLKINACLFCGWLFLPNLGHTQEVSPQSVPGAVTVDVTQAKQLFDEGALFVDVRRDSDWNNGRIPDALHLELKMHFTQEKLAQAAQPNDAIVLYCNGENCLRSSKATQQAVEWGFKHVYYFRDGFPSWKQADLPIE